MKKIPGDIIILQMCQINNSHMINGSWDIKHNRQNFFVTGEHFLPFYSSNNLENQYFEKMKNSSGDIIISHMGTINNNHMMYASWDMECNR